MTEEEIEREAHRIIGRMAINIDHDHVWESLPEGVSDEDAAEIYDAVRSIGESALEAADDPSEWEDEDGETIHLTPKGFIAIMLLDMVPGLSEEDAGELTTDLIEKAVDKAVLDL